MNLDEAKERYQMTAQELQRVIRENVKKLETEVAFQSGNWIITDNGIKILDELLDYKAKKIQIRKPVKKKEKEPEVEIEEIRERHKALEEKFNNLTESFNKVKSNYEDVIKIKDTRIEELEDTVIALQEELEEKDELEQQKLKAEKDALEAKQKQNTLEISLHNVEAKAKKLEKVLKKTERVKNEALVSAKLIRNEVRESLLVLQEIMTRLDADCNQSEKKELASLEDINKQEDIVDCNDASKDAESIDSKKENKTLMEAFFHK